MQRTTCTHGTLPLLLILTTLSSPSMASSPGCRSESSFLWRIRRRPPAYLLGTIHVPYVHVWDHVPQLVKNAFYRVDNVFLELDLTDPTTMANLSTCQLLPEGQLLRQVLPGELYGRLQRHLHRVQQQLPSWLSPLQRRQRIYSDSLFRALTGDWQRKRPVWVMLMLRSLTKDDVGLRGIPVLDLFLAQEAKRLGKSVGALEQVDEQCLPINRLDALQVVSVLNQSLTGQPVASSSVNQLIAQYNCAQLSELTPSGLGVSAVQTGDAEMDIYFRETLIEARNGRMAERIVAALRGQPLKSFLFAFGAGHLLGNQSVISHLQRKGLSVRHVPASPRRPSQDRSSPRPPVDSEQESPFRRWWVQLQPSAARRDKWSPSWLSSPSARSESVMSWPWLCSLLVMLGLRGHA